jgi:hypothetical protein
MTASKVINQQVFKDGKIILYQLKKFQKIFSFYRVKDLKNKVYVYRRDKTTCGFEAGKFA